jgi:ABC-2 type transport system ATP-binding protein
MLRANRLSKSFGAVRALVELDLDVPRGEALCLLGANGAGKTTTINLFLGFVEPSSGEAVIDGLVVASNRLETKRRIAYVPEQVALYPRLSGIENLEFFDELSGNRHSRRELGAFLERVGLEPEAFHRRAASYSKGMRQKVGLAVALAKNARALLLDEPLSGLDPKAANELCRLILELKREGRAVLMATHDLFRAKEIGDRVGIMKQGSLVGLLDARPLQAAEIEAIYLDHMRDLEEVA